MPYIAFFLKERDNKALELKNEGYDIYKGRVSAFSGLGFLMIHCLARCLMKKRDFLQQFFHELTHKTLWVKGSARFNENLASFAEEVLNEKYLLSLKETKALSDYKLYKQDKKNFLRPGLQSLKKA